MTTVPGWLSAIFAGIMLAVAAASAIRLAVRPWVRQATDGYVDLAHLLMGVVMAGMLAPVFQFLPTAAWEVISGALMARFAWAAGRDVRRYGVRALAIGHQLPHTINAAAMLYMLLVPPMAAAAQSDMGGMRPSGEVAPPSGLSVVALILIVLAVGCAVRDLDLLPDRTVRRRDDVAVSVTRSVGQAIITPQLAVCCRVAMGIIMAFMMVIMA